MRSHQGSGVVMAGRGVRDATAFTEFMTARLGSLFRTAYLIVGDHQLAQDLLQESLVKTYVAWPRLERKGGRELMARCPTRPDAEEAAAWLVDRLGRLHPGLDVRCEIEPGGGQYLLVLRV